MGPTQGEHQVENWRKVRKVPVEYLSTQKPQADNKSIEDT